MKKKKLLIAITKGNFGGAQRYVFDLACALHERYEVTVLTGAGGELGEKLADAGIRSITIPSLGRDVNPLLDVRSFFSLLAVLRRERPDILHLNSSKMGGIGALAGRLSSCRRIVFTVHGWTFNEDRKALERTLIRIVYWITLLLVHRAIVVSEAVRRQGVGFPFVQRKFSVVRNGISDTSPLPRQKARDALGALDHGFAERIGQSGRIRVIGTIAELHHIKGIEYALRAIARLKKEDGENVLYAVLGSGEERGRLELLSRELWIADRVFFFGHVRNAARYVSAFDVFLLPSLSEGLAYVVLEAGVAGTPVVASRVGGVPEIIEHEKSGLLIEPRDTEGLRISLERMLADEVFTTRLAQNLRERVLKDFSLARMVRETIELYGR